MYLKVKNIFEKYLSILFVFVAETQFLKNLNLLCFKLIFNIF